MGIQMKRSDFQSFGMSSRRQAYIDVTGKVVLGASVFQEAQRFSEGLAAVRVDKSGWGYIDQTGHFVIRPQFEGARPFSEGLASVKIRGLWGFIDKTGRVVIAPQYQVVNSFSEGKAVVMNGTPDSSNNEVNGSPEAKQLELVKGESRSFAIGSSQKGSPEVPAHTRVVMIIDKNGRIALSLSENEIQLNVFENARFSEGLIDAYDCARKKTGFMDAHGRFVIEPRYDEAAPFSEGLARVAIHEHGEEQIGFVNHQGEFVIAPKFNTDSDFKNSSDFSEGLAGLTENLRPTYTEAERYVFIDRTGSIALMTNFFYAGPYKDGLAAVYDAEIDKWGYIDKSGKTAIPLQFASAGNFSQGLALVTILER